MNLSLDSWIYGILVGLFGLVALVVAGRTADPLAYGAALIVFLFSVLFIFALIKIAYDRAEREGR